MSWIEQTLQEDARQSADSEVSRRLLNVGLSGSSIAVEDASLRRIADAMEFAVMDSLEDEGEVNYEVRKSSAHAFKFFRTLPASDNYTDSLEDHLRTACYGFLADRGSDAARYISERTDLYGEAPDTHSWQERVERTICSVWLLLIRKDGWQDLDRVQHLIVRLRNEQSAYEEDFLEESDQKKSDALRLVCLYHLSKAAEILGYFLTEGQYEGHFEIDTRLQAQFDRALPASIKARDPDLESLVKLLDFTSRQMIDNSIWTVTRSASTNTHEFVKSLVKRGHEGAIFEMLPPQRKTLREEGLLGSNLRSVVVSLPTSSGKTLIAEFRILQAVTQFDRERGWIAYLAPTRTLVDQVCRRLRKDFAPLDISVEKVSPALEVDDLEAELLTYENEEDQFRVLVTTPEKLDLMLRAGWEEEIGRPLTLVVVDEAHNISEGSRGLRLELLLATINQECRNAQFLLLTPFIENASEVAQWLDDESSKDIGYDDTQISLQWKPNDRVVALSQPRQAEGRGHFCLDLNTIHTTKDTLHIPEPHKIVQGRPLGLSWSDVSNNDSNLAAATTQIFKERGPIIVLSGRPDWAWSLAEKFKVEENLKRSVSEKVKLVQDYLKLEFGSNFELIDLLKYGVAVHHAGLSDNAKRLVEWLFENEELDVMVATTTIAQGVNFPVSGVVFAQHQYPYGQDMPPEDFWNVCGRAGRVNHGSVGLVALAARNDEKAEKLKTFVGRQVRSLNSTLIKMVSKAIDEWGEDDIQNLHHLPEWSAFLQYLVHSYRQAGNATSFIAGVEDVLRSTYGFQRIRDDNPDLANRLVRVVQQYAAALTGRPLKLVDLTGFSLESVEDTLTSLNHEDITEETWEPEAMFDESSGNLRRIMGVLLRIPELRQNLEDVLGGDIPDGSKLADMVKDWVNGVDLKTIAQRYYADSDEEEVTTKALTRCCSRLFGKLTQTTSWGLSALQPMSIDNMEEIPENQRKKLQNLPSFVYYGVNSESAMTLRLLGVPRQASGPLADYIEDGVFNDSLPTIRQRLEADEEVWIDALGEDEGNAYYRTWKIAEGIE